MAKARSAVTDYAVYLVIRLVVCVIQIFSFESGCTFACFLAWLAYRIDRRHRAAALENLAHAFPGRWTEAERDRMVRAVYSHFCRLLIEIIHLPRRLHINNWRQYLELVNGRELVGSLLSGRPLLIVTGHFGNWEMAGFALGLLGFRSYAVARPLDNPHLDDFLRQFRERTGQKLLAKHGEVVRMVDILKEGGVIATLADQDAGQRGLFVDFFGRLASTHKAIALLALENAVPLLVVLAENVGAPLHYQLIAEELILPEEYTSRPDAVRTMTQRFTSALERGIRRAPQQYFWLHRRWKHQPQPRKGKKAAA
jgi:KDO2-lipid IV(A) lauroyltransferase